jgi:hypothetical protein
MKYNQKILNKKNPKTKQGKINKIEYFSYFDMCSFMASMSNDVHQVYLPGDKLNPPFIMFYFDMLGNRQELFYNITLNKIYFPKK